MFATWLGKCLPRRRQRSYRSAFRPRIGRLEDRITPVTFAYNAATNPAIAAYTLRVSGASFQVVETANPANVLTSQSIATTTDISITGQNAVNDTLAVDLTGLTIPAGGLTFNGGTGAGTNVLQLQNGSFSSESITSSGPNSGVVQFNGVGAINFSNLTSLDDTTSAADLKIDATAAAEAINIINGPIVGGTQTTQVNSGISGTFELVNFANKPTVTINGLDGADSINVNITTPAVGLTKLNVNAGNGDDVTAVQANVAGVALAFDGQVGTDTLVGSNNATTWNITGAGQGNLNLVSSFTNMENLTGGTAADNFAFTSAGNVTGQINGGSDTDTLDYSALPTAVHANLGIGTTNAASLDGAQETPAVNTTATGSATLTYNATTGKFDVNMTVDGISAEDAGLRFHIHQAPAGVNGPVIVSLFDAPGGVNIGTLTPTAGGFTFSATGISLPLGSEAAFVTDNTYLNVHTTAFPDGQIRGQVVRQTQVATAVTLATGAGSITNFENVTGGSVGDSLVGSGGVNVLKGNGGDDTMLGGAGGDSFTGDAGNDVMVWANGDGSDIMDGGAGIDTVQVNGSVGAAGDDFKIAPNPANTTRVRFDRLNLGLFNLDIGTAEAMAVNGNNGADTFTVNDLTGVANLTTVTLNGGAEIDTFNITPTASITINVQGNQPVGGATGDVVNVVTAGATSPTLSVSTTTFGSQGSFTFGNKGTVNFQGLETLTPAGSDLAVTVTNNQTTTAPGSKVTYTIEVTNNGPLTVTGAKIVDVFPAVLTSPGFTATATGGATGFTAGGTTSINDTVTMPAGSKITYTLSGIVSPSATGTLVNTATVTAPADQPDTNPENNTATDTDTLTAATQGDVSVAMSDSPDPVATGGLLTYTITVSAVGQQNVLSPQLSDVVPAQTTFVSLAAPSGWTTTNPGVGNGGTVTASIPSLAASAGPQTFTLTVRVNNGVSAGTILTNSATVVTSPSDPQPGNNTAITQTTVAAGPTTAFRPIVVGADAGGGPHVVLYNGVSGTVVRSFFAYDASFHGGVRVASGDVTGDGVADILTAAGPGGGPHVKVFDGVTNAEVRSFFAYAASFNGGVFVAAGDVNNDGFADIITGADAGGGPHVIAYSGKDGSLLRSFYAYNANFTGGVRVAAGDVDGDGLDDIITGAGPGGGPHVEAFSGASGSLLQSFYAFDPDYTGGVYVAAGNMNADQRADIITGAGTDSTTVKVFDGPTQAVLASYAAYNPDFHGGARVAAVDFDGNGTLDIVTGAGPGGGPQVRVFDDTSSNLRTSFYAFDPNFQGGVFVG